MYRCPTISDCYYLRLSREASTRRTKYNAHDCTHPVNYWICNKREQILSIVTNGNETYKWKSETVLIYSERSKIILCGFLIQGILRQTSLRHAARLFVRILRFLRETTNPSRLRKTTNHFVFKIQRYVPLSLAEPNSQPSLKY